MSTKELTSFGPHVWHATAYCTRCGVARSYAREYGLLMKCEPPANLVPAAHVFAERRALRRLKGSRS